MFKRDLILAQEYLGFLLLNLFDLFLTGWIFKHQGREGNSVANFVLAHGGLQGFAIYKFLMVVVIVMICEVISLRNLRTARMLVVGAALLYVVVILYECFGIWVFIDPPQPQPRESVHPIYVAMAGAFPARLRGALNVVSGYFSNESVTRV